MVFGVFDGLHPGHHFFLREAARHCETLIVVVTLSRIVETIKQRSPRQDYAERAETVQAFDPRLRVVPGDSVLGTWNVLREHAPDVLILGYDQHGLSQALPPQMDIPRVFIDAFHPDRYKSGLLNRSEEKP